MGGVDGLTSLKTDYGTNFKDLLKYQQVLNPGFLLRSIFDFPMVVQTATEVTPARREY
jgi:hypothetical protein